MSKSQKLQPLILLDDEPVPNHRIDELGLLPFAQMVASVAIGTRGPMNIGVLAQWGEGKSSVLKQAQSLIDAEAEDRGIVTAFFNAWQFENEEQLLVPLIHSVIRAAEHRLAKGSAEDAEYWKRMKRALSAVAYATSTKAKFKVPFLGEMELGVNTKDLINRFEELTEKETFKNCLPFEAFDVLRSLANERRETGEYRRFVILIDDLDRCLPDKGLRLLEGIKLALCQPGFIFVLGLDPRIMEGYIAKRYRDEFGFPDYLTSSSSYFDKIIQLQLPLPPHSKRFEVFIEQLLKRPGLESVSATFRSFARAIALASSYNPRQAIRLINNLLVDQRLYPEFVPSNTAGSTLQRVFPLSLISRSTQIALRGNSNFINLLVNDSALCEALANSDDAFDVVKLTDELQLNTRKDRLALIEVLINQPNIVELLRTDAGRLWLRNHESRKAIHEFLSSFRTVGMPRVLLEVIDMSDPIEVGAQETYEITITNQGSANDTNIVIKIEIPAEMDFISAAGPTLGTASGKNVVFAPLPSLAPKAKAVYKLVTKGTKAADVRLKVEMTTDQTAPTPIVASESTHIY
jgi:uncharacterized repeat protein (TIGR01451 family)